VLKSARLKTEYINTEKLLIKTANYAGLADSSVKTTL